MDKETIKKANDLVYHIDELYKLLDCFDEPQIIVQYFREDSRQDARINIPIDLNDNIAALVKKQVLQELQKLESELKEL